MEDEDVFSKYDRPTTGDQEIVLEGQKPLIDTSAISDRIGNINVDTSGMAGSAKSGATKIILLIVVLAIAYFAVDYFVLSYKQYTVNVTDTEGNPVAASLKVYGEKDQLFSDNGNATYSVKLKAGTYRFEAKATNFKPINKTIDVDANAGAGITIKLEKNMDVEVSSFNFPSELYAGQETEAQVTLTNNLEQEATASLVFESGLASLGKNSLSLEPESISLSAKQAGVPATIKINVPTDVKITDKKNCDTKKASVRIKYLSKKSEEKEFKLCPTPILDLSPKSITKTTNADSANHQLQEIKISNKGTFPIKDISLEIDDSSIKDWFNFEPDSKIDLLNPKESKSIFLWANVPAGTTNQTLAPNLIVSTAGAKQTITMNFTVKEVTIELTATPSNNTINIREDEEINDEYIKLSAKGQDIKNIDLNAEAACSVKWVSFPDGTHIDAVEAGKTVEVRMIVKAPPIAFTPANPVSLPCKVTVRYDDPLGGGKKRIIVALLLVPKK